MDQEIAEKIQYLEEELRKAQHVALESLALPKKILDILRDRKATVLRIASEARVREDDDIALKMKQMALGIQHGISTIEAELELHNEKMGCIV